MYFMRASSVSSSMGGRLDSIRYNLVIMVDLSQFKGLSVREFKGSVETRYGVREISLGSQLQYAVLTTNENFLILDLNFQDISATIRRNAYPRMAKLSPC